MAAAKVIEFEALLAGLCATAQPEKFKKRRRTLSKGREPQKIVDLAQVERHPTDLEKTLEDERSAREAVERKVAILETKREHEIIERDGQIKYVAKEVEGEKCARLDAQECARSDCLVAQDMKLNLEKEQSAHKASLDTIQSLETCFAFFRVGDL
ncbi:uncharacterized protein A4U43_C08F17680 [Asparagus officinalis]|nr:uncharacterized protein A4U43_C08F17680 [Asparagus officinalis]